MKENVSKEELEEIRKNHDETAKPIESWFTSPEHSPEGDEQRIAPELQPAQTWKHSA